MSYQKDRAQFAAVLAAELGWPAGDNLARRLMRRASTSQRLAEVLCCCEMSERQQARVEAQDERNDQAIAAMCREAGIGCELNGDPRGYTVQVTLPSGRKLGVPARGYRW